MVEKNQPFKRLKNQPFKWLKNQLIFQTIQRKDLTISRNLFLIIYLFVFLLKCFAGSIITSRALDINLDFAREEFEKLISVAF